MASLPHVLSYAESEEFEQSLFFYDHDLAERNLAKTSAQRLCLYCDEFTRRTAPVSQRYLFVCDTCGWWQVVAGGRGWGDATCRVSRGRLRRYSIDALDVPLRELRAYLCEHPNHVAFVNPTAFEKLLGDCLRDAYYPCEVSHVGGTADRGVDLLLVRSEEGPRLIQVKRRQDLSSSEGVRVVRELNGVLFREGLAKGIVISTAARYTKAALSEAKIGTPTGETYEMRLMAYQDVVELLGIAPVEPYSPWQRYL